MVSIAKSEAAASPVTPVLDAYNNSPHSATKIAPNKVDKENEIQALMNISKSAKKKK